MSCCYDTCHFFDLHILHSRVFEILDCNSPGKIIAQFDTASVKMDASVSHKTLFIQGIPNSCSNEQLQEVFAAAGPVKKCFVVKHKTLKEGKMKKKTLVGFVTFEQPDSAERAINELKSNFIVNGVHLRITFAKTKRCVKAEKQHKNKVATANNAEKMPVPKEPYSENDTKPKFNKKESLNKCKASVTVVISGLPRSYNVECILKIFKKMQINEPSSLEKSHEDQSLIHAVFPSKQSALKVLSNLSGKYIGKHRVKAELAVDTSSKEFQKSSKKSKLIVRNLSFQCSEKELSDVFEKFGKIVEVKIPTKADGKKRGFAFVQFSHIFEAAKAIEGINMTAIKGRKVAVDWALPREKYQEIMNKSHPEPVSSSQEEINSNNGDSSVESGHDSGLESDRDEEDTDDDDTVTLKDDAGSDEDDINEDNSADEDTESVAREDSESDDEDESDDENTIENGTPAKKLSLKEQKATQKNKDFSSDVHEGKTIFLRNLSFDVQEEELEEKMNTFGETKYCKIVVNRDTGLSKGCAFVQFLSLQDAESCLASLNNESTKLTFDGREVLASVALGRSDARNHAKEKNAKKEKEDKRSLHLANEGLIRPGTRAATGLSEVELNKRRKIDAAKRQKLRNPNVFVSQTRLCVHNIPRAVDNTKLRELFVKAVPGAKITESRVMRDREKLNADGVGRSLGFAFVNFTRHEHALAALREVNNSPEVFGPAKRPIVEFALENKQALAIKRQRRKRQLAKNELQAKMHPDGAPATKRSKQRQKRRDAKKTKSDDNTKSAGEKRKSDVSVEGKSPSKKNKTNPVADEQKNLPARKAYQGSTGTTTGGKKVKMPKHTGPKIRHRDKGQVLERLRASKKLNARKRQTKTAPDRNAERKAKVQSVKKGAGRRGNRAKQNDLREDREFSKLVEKYTQQFKANMGATLKKPKWFET